MLSFSDSSPWPQPKVGACGKPAGQGIGVNYYSLTHELVERDALHLRHPRLLQRQGESRKFFPPVFLRAGNFFCCFGEKFGEKWSEVGNYTKIKGKQSNCFLGIFIADMADSRYENQRNFITPI
jgi:hypothetical protein